MTELEIWLLAVGLAMDCFTVSIATGILCGRFVWRPMLFMAFCFGFFQALMPVIGWVAAGTFSHLVEQVDHWIAFGILAFLGGRMVRDAFVGEEDEHRDYDPSRLRNVLVLSIATSIDALAVGVSFACLGIDGWNRVVWPVAVIGWVSFVASLVGLSLGILFGKRVARRLRPELLGGIILICIGLRILAEHLFFNP